MKTKNPGVSILIAMGTSLLVLALAFATLSSIVKSLQQAGSIQRSTQLFFASETGLEAAFFHHNARGAGTNFTGINTITLDNIGADVNWQVDGRSDLTDHLGDPAFAGVLKENQNIRIPLHWDTSADPNIAPPNDPNGKLAAGEQINLTFYNGIEDIPVGTGNLALEELLTEFDNFEIPIAFNFGDDADGDSSDGDRGANINEVLIDWSFTRKNNVVGIQTFVPTSNTDCSNSAPGLICESQLNFNGAQQTINTNSGLIEGKVLPGGVITFLDDFWNCSDGANNGSSTNCSEYQLNFRPLLEFTNTSNGQKIPGIPYMISLNDISTTDFPRNTYTVNSDVDLLEEFSQQLELVIPERTAVGAFDYVIFE